MMHRGCVLWVCALGLSGCDAIKGGGNTYCYFPSAPEATIIEAGFGGEHRAGDTLQLVGEASDDDSPLSALRTEWRHGDTVFCAGQAPDDAGRVTCMVSLAAYMDIELWVRDDDWQTGSAWATIWAAANMPPEVDLQTPRNGDRFLAGDPVRIEAQLWDEHDPPTDLSVVLRVGGEERHPADAHISEDGLWSGTIDAEGAWSSTLELEVTDADGGLGHDASHVDVFPENTSPTCQLDSPEANAVHAAGEVVVVAGRVDDHETPRSELQVVIESDVDVPDLPFVAAQLDCRGVCPKRGTVNAAMDAVAASDAAVSTFSTGALGRYDWDAWHDHGWGQRALGERFAAALLDVPAPLLPGPALTLTGSYSYSDYGYDTVGWRFTTDQFIDVTDPGQFDLLDDGLYPATTVGIWETESQSLLWSAVVPAGSATDYEGGFRYVGCEPTLLPPGDDTIGLETVEWSPDFYVYGAQAQTADGLELVEGRHVDGGTLAFPIYTVEATAEAAAWLGPNLRYRVAESADI